MSDFYVYSKAWGNKLLVRGYKDGKAFTEQIPYSPTLFIFSPNKSSDSAWKDLYTGRQLDPIKFDSIRAARDFIDTYKDVESFEVHGFKKWEYQWINENYPEKIVYDVKETNILTIDIEVVADTEEESGFPDIQEASVPIVLISMHSTKDDKTVVLGLKPYEKKASDKFEYIECQNEKALLKAFIVYNQKTSPDIWSGWNIANFDTPYLINRIVKLFSEDMVKKLSPFGIIKEKKLEIRGKEVQTYDIYGVVSLDYYELYRKFTYKTQESYALGFITQEELGKTKVDMPGVSFRDNYSNHFQTFVQYSAIDTILVKELNDKMKLIEVAFTMAFMYKCNLADIFKTVLPWEVYIYNHLSKKNIAFPPRQNHMEGAVEGAWVKEPIPGMYGWTMSYDFSSLYPSVIRQWNISPETFHAADNEVGVKDFIECGDPAYAAILHAQSKGFSLAANGTMYDKSRVGFLAELMKECMEGRKASKQEMIELEEEYERTGDTNLLPRISSLNNEQMAFKLAANSVYGATANSGFHFFDYRMAEAITLTGQLSDIHLANMFNGKLNKILKTTDRDYVIYGDTDSCYINVQPIVDLYCEGKSKSQIISFLDKFGNTVCQNVIQESVDEIFDRMECLDKVMESKREAIASKVLFRAKKNYAMYVHNSEGVTYDPPKVKVKGVEIVRSSTPQWCRKKLKDSLQMIFETNEESFRDKFKEYEMAFKKLPADEIAFPRGTSDIDKWSDGGKPKKGTPIAVRAALLYNEAVKKYSHYQQVQNGDKVKFVYLKMPNPIRQNVIGFPSNIKMPKELGLEKYIDYETQWLKTFETPLKSLTDVAGWKLREESNLLEFFQ